MTAIGLAYSQDYLDKVKVQQNDGTLYAYLLDDQFFVREYLVFSGQLPYVKISFKKQKIIIDDPRFYINDYHLKEAYMCAGFFLTNQQGLFNTVFSDKIWNYGI